MSPTAILRSPDAAAAATPVALAEHPALLRRLVDLAPEAMLVLDSQRRVQLVNAHATRLLQFKQGELAGKAFVEHLVGAGGRDAVGAQLGEFVDVPHTVPVEGGPIWRLLPRNSPGFDATVGLYPARIAGRIAVILVIRPLRG